MILDKLSITTINEPGPSEVFFKNGQGTSLSIVVYMEYICD